MKIGFALPNIGPVATAEAVVKVAQRAEALAYDSLWTIERPDGTMTVYDYWIGTNRTNIVMTGTPDGTKTSISDGSKSITVLGPYGQMISRCVIDVASGITNVSELYSDYDDYNRPRKISYLDGTFSWTEFGCCGPQVETNKEGTATFYFADPLKRRAASKKNNITTTIIFDAKGNLLSTIRIGSDGSQITSVTNSYDTAGNRVLSKDALGNTTTYSDIITNAQRLHTTTNPDGSTKIELYYGDGQLAKVTGTAAHPIRYDYGVEQDGGVWRAYTKQIKLDSSGNDTSEWTKIYRDMVGRNYKVVDSDGATRQTICDTKGQHVRDIDPDGVSTVFDYNARGELEYTGIDIDRNGVNDFSGTDRIRRTVKSTTTDGSYNVTRTRSYLWATNNSAVSNLISTAETTTDGLISWSASYGLTNRTQTRYAGSGARYVTNTAPDGSYSVSYYQDGQVISTTRKDASGNQLSQTTYSYDYHGHKWAETDARNGTTVYGYDNGDRMTSVTTPSPGNGKSAQITRYDYDYAGRRTRAVLSDGAGVTNEYYPSGELKRNYGARVYPVAYGYDSQGRMRSMTNWSSFSGQTGARVTTWQYDTNRGFLTRKLYADTNGPSYTYTPAGRMRTRHCTT
jgi:YD repeat-containing protein